MSEMPTTYTHRKPPLAESSEQLRARIPGWGADLDPDDRPSVPRLQFDPDFAGAHWDFPERQREDWPRERSIEHRFVTPVFGTSCPPRLLSGRIRRFSYERYSEARSAHWLLLLLADRVDALEHHVQAVLTLRPDNPITETGVLSELRDGRFASRREGNRTDLVHLPLDPVIVGAPWIAAGAGAVMVLRRLRRRTNGAPSGG
jgi:hypothetical protein